MRRVLKIFIILIAIAILGVLGLSGWLAFIRPELLPTRLRLCGKNRLLERVHRQTRRGCGDWTDVEIAEHRVAKRMKIDLDTANQRVEAAIYGLFARRYAQYAEGRGCTIVSKDEIPDRAAAPPLPPPRRPARSGRPARVVQLSDDKSLAGGAERSGSPGAGHARDRRRP